MKYIRYYASVVSVLLLLSLLIFTSCSEDGSDDGYDNSISTPTGTHNDKGYVDLGLSVKWATCNVGANSPEEYGDYFAWGETEPKDVYSSNTYKWGEITEIGNILYLKYNRTDNNLVLELEDDAASVNWGGNWRMPTRAEQDELRDTDNCTWTWITQNGVKGYKVTSKKNANSIFLPAAGYYDGDILFEGNSYGDYWSSSLDPTYDAAFGMDFEETYIDWYGKGGRAYGRPVRAVCP